MRWAVSKFEMISINCRTNCTGRAVVVSVDDVLCYPISRSSAPVISYDGGHRVSLHLK